MPSPLDLCILIELWRQFILYEWKYTDRFFPLLPIIFPRLSFNQTPDQVFIISGPNRRYKSRRVSFSRVKSGASLDIIHACDQKASLSCQRWPLREGNVLSTCDKLLRAECRRSVSFTLRRRWEVSFLMYATFLWSYNKALSTSYFTHKTSRCRNTICLVAFILTLLRLPGKYQSNIEKSCYDRVNAA